MPASSSVERVTPLVGAMALAAAAVLALAAFREGFPAPMTYAGGAAFALAFFLMDRHAVIVRWRRERINVALTEAVVLAGFMALPAIPILLGAAVARIGMGFATKRPLVKTIFNVSLGVLAIGGGYAIAHGVARLGVPFLLGAVLGSVSYAVLSDLGIAQLFARMEHGNVWRIYRSRLLRASALASVYGTALGLTATALWTLHPLAAFALLPLLVLVHRQAAQEARADRESVIHQRLALDSQALVGCEDARVIAQRAVETCIQELGVGGARVALADGRSWEHIKPEADEADEARAPIIGSDGRARGELVTWSRKGRRRGDEQDPALVGLVASQVATALAGADAIVEARRQRDIVLRQEKMSALGGLVASVAHEVNNPLTYLRGNIELAMLELGDITSQHATDAAECGERATKQLDVALAGAERIGELVKALRAVSRSATNQEPEYVSVNRVLHDVEALMRAALPPNVALHWEADPRDPHVLARPSEMHQVLLNLAKNAVEATAPAGGKVRVRVGIEREDAMLVVEDEGVGMGEETRRALFTPFFTTKGEAGTGLGLAIVHGIVREQGGDIDVESAPGEGARFSVRLPLARRPREPAPRRESSGALA